MPSHAADRAYSQFACQRTNSQPSTTTTANLNTVVCQRGYIASAYSDNIEKDQRVRISNHVPLSRPYVMLQCLLSCACSASLTPSQNPHMAAPRCRLVCHQDTELWGYLEFLQALACPPVQLPVCLCLLVSARLELELLPEHNRPTWAPDPECQALHHLQTSPTSTSMHLSSGWEPPLRDRTLYRPRAPSPENQQAQQPERTSYYHLRWRSN
jgi:hypothetical protein